MRLRDVGIGIRLGGLAAFLMVALIAVAAAGMYALKLSNVRQLDGMQRAALVGNAVDTAGNAQVHFKIQVQEWKNVLLRGSDATAYAKYLQGFNHESETVLENLRQLKAQFAALDLETGRVDAAIQTHELLMPRYVDALRSFDPQKLTSIAVVDALVKGIDRKPNDELDALSTYVLKQAEVMNTAESARARQSFEDNTRWLMIWTLLVLAIGTAAAVSLIQAVLRQLKSTLELTQALAAGTEQRRLAVSAIANGNLDQEIEVQPLPQIDLSRVSSDEVGTMVRSVVAVGDSQAALDVDFRKMSVALRKGRDEEQARDWFKSGKNDLSGLMQGEQEAATLAEKLLTFLVQRLGAGVGAFYLFDTVTRQLRPAATYAATGTTRTARAVVVGEGILGQAVKLNKTLQLQDVPADYLPIASAWGEVPACSVIAMPLLHGGNLIGAVELGAFKQFSDQELDFLEQSREAIALGFDVSLSRQRTVALLEETTQQAEELRVQQEELQQSNEELEERAQMLEQQREQIRAKNNDLEVASREIQRRSGELERVSTYKSEFLANMSHELRTPLNSMLILSGLLKDNKTLNLTGKQVEYAATIHSAGRDLLNLINDILDLSKVEAGQVEFHFQPVAPAHILEAMASLFRVAAEQKSLSFRTDMVAPIPEHIELDQHRTEQVLKNLIGNAIKFTESGEVVLSMRTASASENPLGVEAVVFAVLDTGIGVPDDKLALVFDAFKQADGGVSRKYGGTGLGLSISRQLARKMGGDLTLTSKAGRGSTFTLFLPMQPPVDMPRAPEPAPATARTAPPLATAPARHSAAPQAQNGERSILIIEDDPNFAGILVDFVRERGFQALVAADGEQGIAMARECVPTAVLLDVMLPKVDGWGVMQALKAGEQTRHIPVHFITCLDDSRRALDMGAVGFVTKPVSQQQLDTVFQTIESALDLSVKKLLIVEDNKEQANSIRDLLAGRDVEITIANSGEDAVQKLRTGHFDCMVLDLALPDISGMEVLRQMQDMPQNRRIPVVVHSGREVTREEERMLQEYAQSIIVKGSVSAERLLNEVTLFLHAVGKKGAATGDDAPRPFAENEAALRGKKVLLVDDDMRNIFSMTSLLSDAGLEVTEAENGLEALRKLDANPSFDIVLMDIMMPEMDGFEAMRRIRSNPRHRHLPIVAMTAKAMVGDQQKCLDAGANDYISKPIDTQKLMSLLRVWINRA